MKNSLKNTVEIISNSFKDEGDGVISFLPNGLIITDDQIQRNGTRYDIESLDISKYAGQLTADHEDKLKNILGRVEGVKKKGNTVVIEKIIYAVKESPYARLAYDLTKGGFAKSFSTETTGPPMQDGVHYDHELVGLSQVVTPNNYSATINTFKAIQNSLEQAKADGLDVSELQNQFLQEEEDEKIMDKTEEKKVKEEVVETPVQEVENSVNEIKKVENEITDEQFMELMDAVNEIKDLLVDKEDEEVDEESTEEVVEEPTEEDFNEVEEKQENAMTKDEIKEMIVNAVSGLTVNQASAPEFTAQKTENSYDGLSEKQLFAKQVNAAIDAQALGSIEARQVLNEINQKNLNGLKEAGLVRNSMTLASMGNFVISPKQYDKIVGSRTNYSAILDATNWEEIDTLEYAWSTRNGDIDMQNVALCDANDGSSIRPVSTYEAKTHKETMEEMAAVTPVCDNATRFFVGNLMEDITIGYRTDFDRKRAQLVIAKLEQAVGVTKKDLEFTATEPVKAIGALLEAMATLSEQDGVLIFNYRTLAQIKQLALEAGANGPLGELFETGDLPTIFGNRYIVVPNDLMPSLNSEEVVSHKVNGQAVAIKHAIFYADLSQFVGYTNEGLRFDVVEGATYEENGVVKSGFSRGETVLRGAFFRGGAYRDASKATGILRKGLTKA